MPWQPTFSSSQPAQNGGVTHTSPRGFQGQQQHRMSGERNGVDFQRSGRDFQRSDESGQRQETIDVYVCNIPPDMSEDQLTDLFIQAGEISSVKILPVKEGRDTAIGFVKYRSEESANAAIEQLNGYDTGISQLTVQFPRNKGQQSSSSQSSGFANRGSQENNSQFSSRIERGNQQVSPSYHPPEQQNGHFSPRQVNGDQESSSSYQPTQYQNNKFSSGMGRGSRQNFASQPGEHVTNGFSPRMEGGNTPNYSTNRQTEHTTNSFSSSHDNSPPHHKSPTNAPFTGTVQRNVFQPRDTKLSSGMGRGAPVQNVVHSPPGQAARDWSPSPSRPSEPFSSRLPRDDGERKCHKCNEPGHMARECPNARSGGSGACHKCGVEGHFSRDCPSNQGSTGGRTCHKCGEEGHFSRECPNKQAGGSGACHRCGVEGHFSRDCPTNQSGSGDRTCHRCGEVGHFSRECPNGQSVSANSCHRCGEEGHFARECPSSSGGGNKGSGCHKCGEEGHFARECPNCVGGSGGGNNCHRCGEKGHFARECPNGGGGGDRGSGCHKCGEEGHFARECPNNTEQDGRPAPVTYVPPDLPDAEEMFAQMNNIGINFDQYDTINVNATGNNVPPHIEHFEEAGLYETCANNVRKAHYHKPTPVQKYSIPIILNGRDLMACAQTGSGKTAAFLLPVMTHMLNQGLGGTSMLSGGPQKPLAVVIAPTRELALQIYNEVRKFSDGSIIRPVVCYGGVSVQYQLSNLERGCHILIATPGRLADFVGRGRVSFVEVRYLILDEADRMLDMGFEPEVRKLIEQCNMPDKMRRQTLMFSATFPDEIQKLAADFLNDYIFLAVGTVGGSNKDIEQVILQVPGDSKREKLVELLAESGNQKTLIFVERKRASDFLASFLSQNNFPTTSMSGDRDQKEREAALVDFQKGKAPFLVATAVAARGLDIPDVMHVINFDLPQEIEEYVHRIGRTGRIGKHGKATSFFDVNRDVKLARSLVKVLSDASQTIPDWLENEATDAIGTSFGPAGGRFASRDRRERQPQGDSGHRAQQPRGNTRPSAPQTNGPTRQANVQQQEDDDEEWD